VERDSVDKFLQEMSDTAPTIHRLSFKPPTSLLCSSVTDLLLLYSFPPWSTPRNFDFLVSIIKYTTGCVGVAVGLAAEDGDGDENDEIENAFLVIVGWESIAESEAMNNLPKIEGVKVMLHRVTFQKAVD
jgi:hypothetical protein